LRKEEIKEVEQEEIDQESENVGNREKKMRKTAKG
jgi:hypothetical protein